MGRKENQGHDQIVYRPALTGGAETPFSHNFMITNILLVILIVNLVYLNYQFYKSFTEPRLYHDRLKLDEIYKNWREITNQKDEK